MRAVYTTNRRAPRDERAGNAEALHLRRRRPACEEQRREIDRLTRGREREQARRAAHRARFFAVFFFAACDLPNGAPQW